MDESSESNSDINSIIKNNAANNFEKVVLVSKFVFILLLIGLSFVNVDTSYIINHPKNFLTESFISGLFAVIPVVFMAVNRGLKTENIINAILITFLFFFLLNVLMEFSGLNSYFNTSYFNTNNSNKENNNDRQKVIKLIQSEVWIWIIVLLVSIILSYLSYVENDFKIFSNNKDNFNWFLFSTEMIIFAYFNSLPQVLITRNRNGNMGFSFFTTFIMFIIVYIVLQSGGFFTNVFSENIEDEKINDSRKSSTDFDLTEID